MEIKWGYTERTEAAFLQNRVFPMPLMPAIILLPPFEEPSLLIASLTSEARFFLLVEKNSEGLALYAVL